jgi:hypothetical protein
MRWKEAGKGDKTQWKEKGPSDKQKIYREQQDKKADRKGIKKASVKMDQQIKTSM